MKINYKQAVLGGLLLALFTIFFFPPAQNSYQAQTPKLGEISAQGYTSPISFEVPKSPKDLKKEQNEAREKVLYLFEYNAKVTKEILTDFHNHLQLLNSYGELQNKITHAHGEQEIALKKLAQTNYEQLSRRISSTAINQLSKRSNSLDNLNQVFEHLLEQGVSEALLASTDKQANLYKDFHNVSDLKHILYKGDKVILIKDHQRHEVGISKILPRETVIEDAFTNLQFSTLQSQGILSAYYEMLYAFVSPNVFFLEKETRRLQDEAAAAVTTHKGMVAKGMDIVRPGSIITVEALEKIEALEQSLALRQQNQRFIPSQVGRLLILFIFSGLFVAILVWHNVQNNNHNRYFWAQISIHIVQVLAFFATYHFLQRLNTHNVLFPSDIDLIFLQPFILAPVLSTILFNYKVGLLSVVFSSIHLGIQSGFDLAMSIVIFFIGATTIFFLHNVRYRYQYIFSTFSGFIATIFSLFAYLLLRNRLSFEIFWPHLLIGATSLIISISLSSLFLISLFERLFSLITNLTLIELSDFNHPALKLLSERAPGSFHHSIMVSNLTESAAQTIKANALLARVMALYHDIGKVESPFYFAENQLSSNNAHDQLNPWESVKIIRDHVNYGQKLAKDFKIPSQVAAGITEHHGTSVIQFFFKKAQALHPDKEIAAAEFRHTGTKPQSKESSILMLADSIEAISRSMDEPSAEQLVELVQKVIKSRLEEKQLNESGLTLNELKAIEKGFLHSLEGMYHTRIAYPD